MPVKTIEVCLAPPLLTTLDIQPGSILVVADVLRATTTICTAFDYGAARVFPCDDVETAFALKKQGYFVAGERDGNRLDFADAGNSPFEMMHAEIEGRTLVFTTTNGTQAIRQASGLGKTVLGAFVNLPVLVEWLAGQNAGVIVVCAGWKNRFSLEDTLFAGALAESLLAHEGFILQSDEARMALDLYATVRNDLFGYVSQASHARRLEASGQHDSIGYCLTPGKSMALPVHDSGYLVNMRAK